MKEQIHKIISYLNTVSITEPIDYQVEEIEGQRIVLSFTHKGEYSWKERSWKEFIWAKETGEVVSMKDFNPQKN